MKHIKCIIFAFQEILKIRQILFLDSIALFIKSCNLYFSFLAFTDKERPFDQLHRAMQCASLSAIYDYDTDWGKPAGLKNHVVFVDFLGKYITSSQAQDVALQLFIVDSQHKLSECGLERGSAALLVYALHIGSRWLSKYSKEEIEIKGRKLQQVDDALDIIRDFRNGDKNSFLINDLLEKEGLIQETKEFLEGDFFRKLADNSFIYRFIRWQCKKMLRLEVEAPFWRKMVSTSRPYTVLFAGLVTWIGFRFHDFDNLTVISLTLLGFLGITSCIMSFNDLIDRENDKKKKKFFASQYHTELKFYCEILCLICIIILLPIAFIDMWLFSFCMWIFLLGMLYSFITHWYIIQNLVVAVCAAAPILCGSISLRQFNLRVAASSMAIFGIIWAREIIKDIEDRKADLGYKVTIPIKTADSNGLNEYCEGYILWLPKCCRNALANNPAEIFPVNPELFNSLEVIGSIIYGVSLLIGIIFGYWAWLFIILFVIFWGNFILAISNNTENPESKMGQPKKIIDIVLFVFVFSLAIAL